MDYLSSLFSIFSPKKYLEIIFISKYKFYNLLFYTMKLTHILFFLELGEILTKKNYLQIKSTPQRC